ncbi:glycine betaine ABC transporter substrate-binding protein [Candidatus Parabeggiatoa sp. HSG14]|uniref:glycine betaine ABC transporter substrate-binding protein n=1 Tax=Candidatus Parabeggiatoa sp. HSG14 TaxID=3055593 RepID=UPI0025A8CE10|nr:glycine betaine ABC transporter substrate-binding protein [Thiotrichales bacterium HSG14]
MKKLFFCFALSFIVMGCTKIEPLHIGSKEFTEQLILAEIIAKLLEHENIPVKRSIPFGDTFANLEAIKNGDLDLYVEYNGTGLSMLGQPPTNDGDKAFAEVKKLFKPLGLEWLNRLGFSNDYVLIMRRDRALALKISKISELVKITPNIRMSMEPEFLERPLDGFMALQRRYGLRNLLPILVDHSKSAIYQALLDGKVDVVEGFATEGRIEDFGLMILEDDLAFFPVYQPSPVVRTDALERFPNLRSALQKLVGIIDTTTMRQLNREVESEGQDYKTVAQAFLVKHHLIKESIHSYKSEELSIAAGKLNELGRSIGKALRATRKTFPGRRVKALQVADPLQAILNGQARLGILSAETFFNMTDDFLPVQNKSVEAIGVIGNRMAHIVTLRDNNVTTLKDIEKLGVGAENSASDRSANMILTSLGLLKKTELIRNDDLPQQIKALKQQKLDGILLMVPLGHEQLTAIMNQSIFKLLSLKEWQEGNHLIRFPFFRLARIPANTYDQQSNIIETVSTQMVLAGPTPIEEVVGNRGPATVIGIGSQPLSDSLTLQLSKELGTNEKLDPALPSADILKPQTQALSKQLNPSRTESFVNLLIVIALFFFLHLFLIGRKE